MSDRYLFGENSDSKFGSIIDGTSNTVAVSESLRTVANGHSNAWGYRAWGMSETDLAYGINATSIPSAWTWISDHTDLKHRLRNWGSTGSLHPGGLNVCRADGSVRFITASTPTRTLRALCTIAGGETVELP